MLHRQNSPRKKVTKKVLWVNIEISKNEVIENYRTSNTDRLYKEDLESMYKNSISSYRTKKKNEFATLEFIEELYVTNRESITSDDFRKIKDTGIFLNEKSSYKTDYWKSLKQWGIPEINKQINNELGKSLILNQ